MSDLISRRQAIDAIDALHDQPNAWLDQAVEAVERLPSAEPELLTDDDFETRRKNERNFTSFSHTTV